MNLKTEEILGGEETEAWRWNWSPFNARFESASTCVALLTEYETDLDISQWIIWQVSVRQGISLAALAILGYKLQAV